MSSLAKGPLTVNDDGKFMVHYRTESDVRDALADLAYMCGWIVQREVVIPGWGRVDLVLRERLIAPPYLVEIKLELTKPSAIRKAFQQIDGYSRQWTNTHDERSIPVLAACVTAHDLVAPVADAYPSVSYYTASDVMGGLASWGYDPSRLACADRRLRERQRLLDLNEKAVAAVRRMFPEPTPPDDDPAAAALGTTTQEYLATPEGKAA